MTSPLRAILLTLIMTAVSGFVLWLGLRDGNYLNLGVGLVGLAFFGFGAVLLLWRTYGPASAAAAARPRRTVRPKPAATTEPRAQPELNAADHAALERVLDVLARHGVFAPEVPTAAQLEAAAADYGAPMMLETPVAALYSAPYYDAGFDVSRYTANLRLQHGKVEQTPDVIASQLTDIAALSDSALSVSDIDIRDLGDTVIDVTFKLNGAPQSVRYRGASKYMSTVLLHHAAAAYRDLDLGNRMAAITSDGDLYLTRLPDGAVEQICEELAVDHRSPSMIFWLDDPSQSHEAGAA